MNICVYTNVASGNWYLWVNAAVYKVWINSSYIVRTTTGNFLGHITTWQVWVTVCRYCILLVSRNSRMMWNIKESVFLKHNLKWEKGWHSWCTKFCTQFIALFFCVVCVCVCVCLSLSFFLRVLLFQWFTRAGREQSLKEAIDFKGHLSAAKQKYSDLHIIGKERDEPKLNSPGANWAGHCLHKATSAHLFALLNVVVCYTDAGGKDARPAQQHERPALFASSLSSSSVVPSSWSSSSVAAPDLSLDPTTQQAQFSALAKKMKVTADSKWASN